MRTFGAVLLLAAVVCGEPIPYPTGIIDTYNTPTFSALRKAESGSGLSQFFVQLNSIPVAQEKAELESYLGVSLNNYVGAKTYVIVGDDALALKAERSPLVGWVGKRASKHRIAHSLQIDFAKRDQTGASSKDDSPDLVKLWVLLVQHNLMANRASSQRIASSWSESIKGIVEAIAVSSNKIEVIVEGALLSTVAGTIASDVQVEFVEQKSTFSFKNYYAELITTGQIALANQAVNYTAPRSPFLASMNLDGSGQLVGVADSGIDWRNCMFWMPNVTPPFNAVDLTSRKIAAYWIYNGSVCGNPPGVPCGDSGDDQEGHGTHVSGTASGLVSSPNLNEVGANSPYNGVAPGAKIAFTDISVNGTPGLSPPSDLRLGLFPDPYNAGARIHSNSWGCSPSSAGACNFYQSPEAEIDQFMFENPTFLVLIAAGNSGQAAENGTIESPAGAKNIISVGASEKTVTGAGGAVTYQDPAVAYCPNFQPPAPTCCNADVCSVQDCCNSAQQYGVALPCCPNGFSAPTYGNQNLADFSSRGPTMINGVIDNRIKPDLVVPGDSIVSAKSQAGFASIIPAPLCGITEAQTAAYVAAQALKVLSGTSMACPHAAGLAALVRQYYVQGVGGITLPNPTAALVKATLVMAATMMTGGANILRPPSQLANFTTFSSLSLAENHFFQGFGLVDLSTVLLTPTSRFQVFVDDNISGVNQGESVIYTFLNVDLSSTAFTAVMAYSDCPASPSATKALVNDLNLAVTVAASTSPSIVVGTTYFPNDLNGPDLFNNVEKTIIPSTGVTGTVSLSISITGTSVTCLSTSARTYTGQIFSFIARGVYQSSTIVSNTNHPNNIGAAAPNVPPSTGSTSSGSYIPPASPGASYSPLVTKPPGAGNASTLSFSAVLWLLVAIMMGFFFV